MMTRFNELTDSLNATLKEMVKLSKEMTAKADAKKASILVMLQELGEIRNDIHTISTICDQTGAALFDMADVCDTVTENIDESFYNFEGLPEGSYETFVGFCDECGKELHCGDDFEQIDSLNILCADCALRADEQEEDLDLEDEDEDEFEPLKETVESEVETNV